MNETGMLTRYDGFIRAVTYRYIHRLGIDAGRGLTDDFLQESRVGFVLWMRKEHIDHTELNEYERSRVSRSMRYAMRLYYWRICNCKIHDNLNDRFVYTVSDMNLDSFDVSDTDPSIEDDTRFDIQTFISTLNDTQRELLEMLNDGWRVCDIAHLTGTPRPTIDSRLLSLQKKYTKWRENHEHSDDE